MLRLKRERENANEKVVASRQLRKFGLIAAGVLLGTLLLSNLLTKYFAGKKEGEIMKNTNMLYCHLLTNPPQYASALHMADSLYTAEETPQYALLLTTAFYSYLNIGGYIFDEWTLPESPDNNQSAFSKDGQFLYFPFTNNRKDTFALTLKTGKLSPIRGVDFGQKLFNGEAYSVDSQWFAQSMDVFDCRRDLDGKFNIYLTQKGTLDTTVLRSPNSKIFELGFTQNNQKLITLGQEYVKLWHFRNPIMSVIKGHSDFIHSVFFSPDNRFILSASEDSTACIWSLDGQRVQILRGHKGGVRSAIYTPDGKYITTISDDGFVKLWQPSDGTEKQSIDVSALKLEAAQFDKSGRLVVEAHTSKPILFKYEQEKLVKIGMATDSIGHDWTKNTAPETGYKAQIEANGKMLNVYDKNDNIIAQLNAQETFRSVQFAPDGNSLVVADGQKIIRLPMPAMIQTWLKSVGFHR